MSKRNAHAVAASHRKAGPIEKRGKDVCTECGKDMGYGSPSPICAPCDLFDDINSYEEGDLMELAARWQEKQ